MVDLIKLRSDLLSTMKSTTVISAIKTVDLNVTELCNRTCVFCPRVDASQYPNQNLNMSMLDAAILAERLQEISYLNEIQIGGQGEPLLHPDILGIVALLREAMPLNKNIHITTNADRLTRSLADDLVVSGLDRLYISLYDGPEQKETLQDMLAGLPIEVIWKEFWHTAEEAYGITHISNRAGKLVMPDPVPQQRCNLPFYSLSVDWNLAIRLCVHDWNKDFAAGSLRTSSIKEVWLSPAMQEYRLMLSRDKRNVMPCALCNVSGQFYGNDSWQTLNTAFNYT